MRENRSKFVFISKENNYFFYSDLDEINNEDLIICIAI